MSEFEYSSDDSGRSSDSEDDIFKRPSAMRKKPDIHTIKILKELRLYYSNVFADSFYLIDSFIKSKKLTYGSFLKQFDDMKFYEIYAKPANDVQNAKVSPHHFITTTQDALAISSKFLRSRSKNARIGAIYLLYTLWKTQPLKIYPLNVKMEPQDYVATKELVQKCFNEGLLHPAYCFYNLEIKKKITITAAVVNPCLEANYPRLEIRKHMGRVTDRYFQTEYKEREELNLVNQFQLIEQQMRSELTYINKLSIESLGRDPGLEYKAVSSKMLEDISIADKSDDVIKPQSHETDTVKKSRYKTSKNIAFPGVNEDILEDMVTCEEPQKPIEPPSNNCDTKKKKKQKKKKRIVSGTDNTLCNASVIKEKIGTSSVPLSVLIGSDSDCSVADSDDNQYDEMFMRILDG